MEAHCHFDTRILPQAERSGENARGVVTWVEVEVGGGGVFQTLIMESDSLGIIAGEGPAF